MGSPAIPFGRGPRRALRAWLRETPCGNSGRARGTAIEGAGWLRGWVHCEKGLGAGVYDFAVGEGLGCGVVIKDEDAAVV